MKNLFIKWISQRVRVYLRCALEAHAMCTLFIIHGHFAAELRRISVRFRESLHIRISMLTERVINYSRIDENSHGFAINLQIYTKSTQLIERTSRSTWKLLCCQWSGTFNGFFPFSCPFHMLNVCIFFFACSFAMCTTHFSVYSISSLSLNLSLHQIIYSEVSHV